MRGFGVALVSALFLSGAASLAVANAGGTLGQGGATGGMGGQPGQTVGQPGQQTGQAGGMGQGQPQGAPAGGQPPAQGGGQGLSDAPTRQSMDELVEEAESQAGEPPEPIEGAGAESGRFDD